LKNFSIADTEAQLSFTASSIFFFSSKLIVFHSHSTTPAIQDSIFFFIFSVVCGILCLTSSYFFLFSLFFLFSFKGFHSSSVIIFSPGLVSIIKDSQIYPFPSFSSS
jgi:hypothetical protein